MTTNRANDFHEIRRKGTGQFGYEQHDLDRIKERSTSRSTRSCCTPRESILNPYILPSIRDVDYVERDPER